MNFKWLQEVDTYLFHFFNSTLTNKYFDVFFPFLTDLHKFKWILYGILPTLLCFFIYKIGRRFITILIYILVTIGICDTMAYRVFKKSIQRPRPHQLAEIKSQVRVPHKPTDFSFPSNHATNSAGVATILLIFFPHLKLIFIPLVFLIGWSRVYVGVHFPSDIIAGWILGVTLAVLIKKSGQRLFQKQLQKQNEI